MRLKQNKEATSLPTPTSREQIVAAYLADPSQSLTDLAEKHGVTRQAISAMLKRAEEDGMITARPGAVRMEERSETYTAVTIELAEGASIAEVAEATRKTPKQIYRLIDVDEAARKAYEVGREKAKRERVETLSRIQRTIAWRGMSEASAAEAAGIEPAAFYHILAGRMKLHPEIIPVLAKVLRVSIVWLETGERQPEGMKGFRPR